MGILANRAVDRRFVLMPLRGVSMLGSQGGPFWDEAAEDACFDALRSHLKKRIPMVAVDRSLPPGRKPVRARDGGIQIEASQE